MALPRVPRWRLAALAAVVVPAIFMLTQKRGSDAAPVERNASERERLERIERELQTLGAFAASGQEADRAQLESRINALKLEVTRLGKTLVEQEKESRAEARPTTDETPVQLATLLDERFADEAGDSTWSAAAAQEISRSLVSPGLENTQLGDVRCRATLCRIEASHGSIEAERKFIARIGELEAFRNGEGFVERVPRSDGSIATMVFVSRSGHRLPSLPDVATFPFM